MKRPRREGVPQKDITVKRTVHKLESPGSGNGAAGARGALPGDLQQSYTAIPVSKLHSSVMLSIISHHFEFVKSGLFYRSFRVST